MVLKQWVWVWVSVVPNIFMISLTFVRYSNGSHGIVVRTTGFWSCSSGFEFQPLPTFLTQLLRQKIVIPPPFSCMKSVDTRIFLKPGRVPLRNVSVMWDQTISTEDRDTRPLLCIKIFETAIFLKHRRVPLRIFSALWDKKFPTEDRDINLFCIKFFDTLYQIFWYSETKQFRRKIVIPAPLFYP